MPHGTFYIEGPVLLECGAQKPLTTRIERRHYKYLKGVSKRMVFGPFECPTCGSELFFSHDKDRNKMITKCQCGVQGEWDFSPVLQPVDYYSKLVEKTRSKT